MASSDDVILTKDQIKANILFTPCRTKADLGKWIKVFFDIDLPDCLVDESSTGTPLDMVWDTYNHFINPKEGDPSRILYYAARDAGKTLSQSILESVALLHLGCDVVHLAAVEEQSQNALKYIKKNFRRMPMAKYVVGSNKRSVEIIHYTNQFTGEVLNQAEYSLINDLEKHKYKEQRNVVEIIVASVESCNGKHAPILCLDETDILKDQEAYAEAKMIPSEKDDPRFTDKIQPVTILTSTRKYSIGNVQNEIDDAARTGLVVKHWNIIDVTQPCPKSRHRPDLPKLPIYRSDDLLAFASQEQWDKMVPDDQLKYVKDEGFHGCLNSCSLFPMCKGNLATKQTSKSRFLKTIHYTVDRFKVNSIEKAKAQLLCWKPSSVGMIYPNLDKLVHALTPADIYERVFGHRPSSPIYNKQDLIADVKAKSDARWVAGMDFGYTHNFVVVVGFIYNNICYIIDCHAQPELEIGEQIELCNNKVRYLDPSIYADPENPQVIASLRKEGFRMKTWKKGKGTVLGGIEIVRLKLRPALGKAQLFFLAGDPGVEFLMTRMSRYHWKLDAAGNPTDTPNDKEDDECDGLRYLVLNSFTSKGKLVAVNSDAEDKKNDGVQKTITNHNDWMKQEIQEHVGDTSVDVSTPAGKVAKTGKKGGFSWSF